MAVVTAYASLDMTAFNFANLANGDYYDGNTTYFDVYYNSGYADAFAGFGFSYIGNEPVSGTVTDYGFVKWTNPAGALVEITGLSIPMTDIVSAANTIGLTDDAFVIATALAGPDIINGSPYDDVLFGAGGKDLIRGGAGADIFLYFGKDGVDKVRDFNGNQGDMIDLSLIDANSKKGGNQKFKYIGDKKPKKAGQLAYDGKKLLGNTDGDKKAELKIKVPDSILDKGDLFL